MIEIRLLGRFSVWRDGTEVPAAAFRGRLVRSLVRILATQRGMFVSRDVLAEALWGDAPPADPNLNLNVLVTRARSALGDPGLIVTGPGGYSLAPGPGCRVDAEGFLELVQAGRMMDALGVWAGDPLGEDAYADWAQGYRERLRQAHLDALEGAALVALDAGAPARAVGWARAAAALEPLREAPHLLLARALAESWDSAGALEVLAGFRHRLGEELGLDPSPATQALETGILRGEIGAGRTAPAFGRLPFMGREGELRAILAMVSGAAVVAGPSGAGKSRLLSEAVARSGRRVLAAGASFSERDEPWHVAAGLVRASFAQDPRAADGLPPLAAHALAASLPEFAFLRPAAAGPADVQSLRALVLEAAVRIVGAAGGPGCLLAVDDLQWADASSLAVLERVVSRLPAATLVATLRPEEVVAGGPVDVFLTTVAASGKALVRLDLGPLTAEALGAAIADPALISCVVQHTDCSPMAVVELVRELARGGGLEAGGDGRWAAASDDLYAVAQQAARRGHRATIASRVSRLPESRLALLRLVSLLGRPSPSRLVAAAGGGPAASVLSDLEALGTAGLVRVGPEGWSVAHDLIAEVAVGVIPSPTRARLHEQLASVLAHDGADPAEVARHLACAGDGTAAARAFADAAARRLERFAHSEAEQVATQGLAIEPSSEVASSLLEVRAEARARTGNLGGAREDLRGALVGAHGPRRSQLLARMALLASGADDMTRAGELVDLALADAAADPAARAAALSVGAIIDMNANQPVRAELRSDEALALFRRLNDARGIADVLDARAMARFLAGDIRGAVDAFDRVARLFEDSGDLLRVGTPRSTRGHGLTFLARPAEGLADAQSALDLARTLGHAEGEAYALWHCSEAWSALAQPDEALKAAAGALAIAERIGHREWTAASWRAVGIAHQAAGDLAGAEAAFRRSLEASENLTLFARWAQARIALVLVAAGDLAGAGPYVVGSLAAGPELSRYEARLAQAELAAASRAPDAAGIVAKALDLAHTGGHVLGAQRLSRLTPPRG